MNKNDAKVYKFGGASVKDVQGYRNVANIIGSNPSSSQVVVLSAMGKTTNALEKVVHALYHVGIDQARDLLSKVKSEHERVCQQMGWTPMHSQKLLGRFDQISGSLDSIREWPYNTSYDHIVALGELTSTAILTSLLICEKREAVWLDAREVIATNGIHRDATVEWDKTSAQVKEVMLPMLNEGKIIVTQGFIGGYEGQTTTLGREGSDYTGAILAYVLEAESLTIWKDVPGILTGDPREFDHVMKLDRLSYREAIEMTYYGAKVIHPKTIKPLQNKGIPLFVRPFEQPDDEGTVITHDVEVAYPPIVVVEKNQCMLHISTMDYSFVAEHHMSLIFNTISRHRIKVNMMRNTAISFSVCVTHKEESLKTLIEELSTDFNVISDCGLELITMRHYVDQGVHDIVGNRIVIFEERIKDTLQMVVKQALSMRRKRDVESE